MAFYVDTVIKIAKNEVGYLEKSRAAYLANKNVLNDKVAGAGNDNYTKYGRDMHALYPAVMDFPAAWCDCFVDWCFYVAYGVTNAKALLAGDFNDYTKASASLYKKKNAYYKSSPKIGDQIFFKNSNGICHTGLVYAVDDTYVYTIEGNTSSAAGVVANGGCVALKKYKLNYSKIDGYGRPNYSGTTNATSNASTGNIVKDAEELKLGSKGQNVKKLQVYLNANGYDCGKADGEFGKDTLTAVKKWQAAKGLTSDGIINKDDWAIINKYPVVKFGDKGVNVTAWQNYLNSCGYNCGKADGDFGNNTLNALKKWQRAKKLPVTGIIDDDWMSV